jgi:hypothetical protein
MEMFTKRYKLWKTWKLLWTSKRIAKSNEVLKAVREFGTYITANRTFIPNYGDRYRHGETISTGFVESAINQGYEQTDGEETADAVDRTRCPSFTASADPRFEWELENWRSTLSHWYPAMQVTCDAKAA